MKILQKKRDGHQPPNRIQKRVSKIATPDLIQWMEHSTITIGRCISEWQRSQSSEMLDEVLLAAEVFHEIAKELKRRN